MLGVERVGRHDNYFELGGHSLLAMRVMERMRREGIHTDVRTLFTTRALYALADRVDQNGVAVEVPENLITPDCEQITPGLLPLVELTQTEIDRIVSRVPGGARNVQDIYPLVPAAGRHLVSSLVGSRKRSSPNRCR